MTKEYPGSGREMLDKSATYTEEISRDDVKS